jgi:UDP-glucose 4-epimerase
VFNVGTGEETSINRLHELCRLGAGVDDRPLYEDARLGDARRSVLDVSLIARELDWRPQVSLDEGLRHTWEWTKGRRSQ